MTQFIQEHLVRIVWVGACVAGSAAWQIVGSLR